jgi:hypothetical protein
MITIKTLLVIVAMMMIVGASLWGTLEDIGFLIFCGFCKAGQEAVFSGIATITKAGQDQIKDGVKGILFLKENEDLKETDPVQFNLLLKTAQNQIWGGTFLTLIYIFIFYMVISRVGEWIVGFYPPFLFTILLSIASVGIVTWAFNGFSGFPFDGWYFLATHWEIWEVRFLEVISPVPIEALNATTGNITL